MKKLNKNILFSLGTLSAIAIPVAAVVACGDSEESSATLTLNAKSTNLLALTRSVDVDDKIVEAVTTDENISSIKEAVKALENKTNKFAIAVNFADSNVVVDVQIKWSNNKPTFTVNKVYIEKGGKDITTTEGKFKVSLFKAFARKYLQSLVDAQKAISASSTNDEITKAIKDQYSLVASDANDPQYFFTPANGQDTNISVLALVKSGIDFDKFVEDMNTAAKSTDVVMHGIMIESRDGSKISIMDSTSTVDFKDLTALKTFLNDQRTSKAEFDALFK